MTPSACLACAGLGVVPGVRWARCCSGRGPWGEVRCGCGGGPVPEAACAPCPRGCAPAEPEPPPPPDPDPHYW